MPCTAFPTRSTSQSTSIRITTLATLILAIIGVTSAFAAEPQIHVTDHLHTGNLTNHDPLAAGPYTVRPDDFGLTPVGLGKHSARANEFLTFSLLSEPQLRIASNHNVSIQFDLNAHHSDTNATTNTTPIDTRFAFLYTIFTNDEFEETLNEFITERHQEHRAGTHIVNNINDSSSELIPGEYTAHNMQDAIWFIEGKLERVSVRETTLVALADRHVYENNSDWFGAGLGDVRIMNVTGANYGVHEQLLVMIPMPVPAALALAGILAIIGMTVIGGLKRRHHYDAATF